MYLGRILIIDDDPIVADATAELLREDAQQRGHEIAVISTTDPHVGLKQLESQLGYEGEDKIRVVVLDLNFPNANPPISGEEILWLIRRRGIPVKVVVLTGNGFDTQDPQNVHSIVRHCEAFVEKGPKAPALLSKTVLGLLEVAQKNNDKRDSQNPDLLTPPERLKNAYRRGLNAVDVNKEAVEFIEDNFPDLANSSSVCLLAGPSGSGKSSVIERLSLVFDRVVRQRLVMRGLSEHEAWQQLLQVIPNPELRQIHAKVLRRDKRFRLPVIIPWASRRPHFLDRKIQERFGQHAYFDNYLKPKQRKLEPLLKAHSRRSQSTYIIWRDEVISVWKQSRLYSKWLGQDVPVILQGHFYVPVVAKTLIFPKAKAFFLVADYYFKLENHQDDLEERVRQRQTHAPPEDTQLEVMLWFLPNLREQGVFQSIISTNNIQKATDTLARAFGLSSLPINPTGQPTTP